MAVFANLEPGDMFNTKLARFVKLDNETAICVYCNMFPLSIGGKHDFKPEDEIVVLYSARLAFCRECGGTGIINEDCFGDGSFIKKINCPNCSI